MENTVIDIYKFIWTLSFCVITTYLCLNKYIDAKTAVFSASAFVAYHIFMGFTTGWGYNDLAIILGNIFLSYYLTKVRKKYID